MLTCFLFLLVALEDPNLMWGPMWLLLLCHGDPGLTDSQLNREVKLLANLAPPSISGSSALQLVSPLIIINMDDRRSLQWHCPYCSQYFPTREAIRNHLEV
jgi:hypothetical protein